MNQLTVMKKHLLTTLALAALLFSGAPAFAGAGKANGKNKNPNRGIVTQFDTSKDGTIDGAEKDALRAAFKAGTDASLKTLDTNSDGSLDDNEIAAIKAKSGGKGGKKKKKAAQ